MQLKKIAAHGLAPGLKRHFSDITRGELGAEIVNSTQSLGIRNGLDIKNQYRRHSREICLLALFEKDESLIF
jgi:hypothetical protein